MGRIMAIDYGAKRTGLAVTDPLKIIATPLDAVDTHKLTTYLEAYFKSEAVELVVLGLPTQADGTDTNNTDPVRRFAAHFKNKFPLIPLTFQDEYGTSRAAMKSMVAGGVPKKSRQNKKLVDKVSAVLILQAYMDLHL